MINHIRVRLKLFGRSGPVSVRFSVGLFALQKIDVVLNVVEDHFNRQFWIYRFQLYCGSMDAPPPGKRIFGFFHGENLTF